MGWMEAIGTAIQYIEEHITDELTVQMIADHVNISSFYFQKGFAMLCGFTISEYIRNRRLALAGNDLATGAERIFEYLIADPYEAGKEVPEGFVTRTIPEFTWAIFPCTGAMPNALQDANTKIFTEWLPALKEYEFAAGYCVEMYDDPTKYPNGPQDENYYCEIWIPVKQKQ